MAIVFVLEESRVLIILPQCFFSLLVKDVETIQVHHHIHCLPRFPLTARIDACHIRTLAAHQIQVYLRAHRLSDAIRGEIAALGWEVRDTPQGQVATPAGQ